MTLAALNDFFAVRIALGLTRQRATAARSESPITSNAFCENVITLTKFQQIQRFLHCANNTENPSRGQPGHDSAQSQTNPHSINQCQR